MTNESAYQIVRKFINQQFNSHLVYIAIKDQAAAKSERDRALGCLAQLLPPAPTAQPLLVETEE